MQAMARKLMTARNCGVFQLTSEPHEVEREAKGAGLAVFRVDLAQSHDKEGFIEALARAMKFPAWAGRNWDALNDCLTDLEWLGATGFVLILEQARRFATARPGEFESACEVLLAAVDHWKAADCPFWVLIPGTEGWHSGLPKWPQ